MVEIEESALGCSSRYFSPFDGFEYAISFLSDIRINLVIISSIVFSPEGEILSEDSQQTRQKWPY